MLKSGTPQFLRQRLLRAFHSTARSTRIRPKVVRWAQKLVLWEELKRWWECGGFVAGGLRLLC
jgi:hypothetical protein